MTEHRPHRAPGRRAEDFRRNIEIHPVHLIIISAAASVIVGIFGYFAKSWADNITYELRQFRLSVEELAKQNAQTITWKQEVDRRLSDTDDRLNFLERAQFAHSTRSGRARLDTAGGSK